MYEAENAFNIVVMVTIDHFLMRQHFLLLESMSNFTYCLAAKMN